MEQNQYYGEEDEEALSLSDLPLIHNSRTEESCPHRDDDAPEDFDFCSLSKEHEMCAADDVFFQGQILPLRHSVSSEKGLLLHYPGNRMRRSISRSESMDHYYSGGFISSRSSSISSSHQSSSSGSGGGPAAGCSKYKPKFNQFHSHPSPSPRIHFPTNRQTNHRNYTKKSSSIWNVFRLGLVTTPPEIAFQNLKTRANCKNFGSRNSTSSNGSSIVSITSSNKKKKQRSFLSGCKCSADAVATVPSRVVIIKRSASEGDVELALHQVEEENVSAKMAQKRAAKKQLSHHRTFEWLKQLSIEGPADEA